MKRLILIFAGLLLAFSVSAQYRPQEASFSGTAADGAIIYYDNSTGLWSIASVSKILWDETNNELDLGASTKLIFGTDVTLVRNAANVLDLQDKFLLSYGSQDYLFTDQGANLALQSQTTATDGFLDLFTKDGDGTDNLYLEIYGVGLPTDVTNREKILIGYNNANQFEIFTEEAGTGVGRDMVLFTEKADGSAFNTNQLVLATDGNVGIGTVSPATTLDVAGVITTEAITMDGMSLSLCQGVTWDSDGDTYTRLGSLKGIATAQSAGNAYLPIQSDMKRCLLADAGTVNYYLDADSSYMKEGTTVKTSGTTDGTTGDKLEDSGADFVTDAVVAGMMVHNITDDTWAMITARDDLNTLSLDRDIMVSGEVYVIGTAVLNGDDGQVMVEIPKFYFKHDLTGTVNSWYISKYDLPGFDLHPAFWKDGAEVDYRYYSAFEGSMYDDSEGAMTAKASIPTDLYAANDEMCSVAGQWPKVNETRAEYRTMAAERGAGFRQLDYYLHSAVQLLYLVEYADFNAQSMIGGGRTNLTGGGWTADSYIAPTGLSISDGNGTNSVMSGTLYSINGTGYLTDYMTYRGIENLFGNVWKMLDGIAWDGSWTGAAAAQPVYVTNNSSYFADQVSTNMKHLCDASYIGADAGYISNIEEATGFIPSAVGASSTTDLCDYYYQYSQVGRDYWRVVLAGYTAVAGGAAGVFALNGYTAWSNDAVNFAGRLCY